MKTFAFVSLLAISASFCSTNAMAQAYVAVDVGQGHANVECSGVSSCDKSGTAIKLTGGYAFSGGLAGEVGYINFGKINAADPGLTVSSRAQAVTLGLAYEMPLDANFAVAARAGIASVRSKAEASISGFGSGSTSQSVVSPYFGIGASYALNKRVKIRAGADFTRGEIADEKYNLRAITVGARYDF